MNGGRAFIRHGRSHRIHRMRYATRAKIQLFVSSSTTHRIFDERTTYCRQASTQMKIATILGRYLAQLSSGKIILWCYLIWYLVIVIRYFDPTPAIWLNSLGIGAVVGFALRLGVGSTGQTWVVRWQTARLFLTPFCVSSFSSLIKGRGFILVAPPSIAELVVSLGCCMTFVFIVLAVKSHANRGNTKMARRQ